VDVDEIRRQAATDLEKAQAEVAKAQAVVDWLERLDAIERPNGQVENAETAASTTTMRFGRPVPEVAQTDLCMRALGERGRSMNARDISEWLARQGVMAEDGRPYNPVRLRSTLKHLSRQGKVVSAGKPGLWRLPAPKVAAGSSVGSA
jgi:hypothetical protein